MCLGMEGLWEGDKGRGRTGSGRRAEREGKAESRADSQRLIIPISVSSVVALTTTYPRIKAHKFSHNHHDRDGGEPPDFSFILRMIKFPPAKPSRGV